MSNLREKIIEESLKLVNISIISLVEDLIVYAETIRASDIHIDPTNKNLRVRMRVDGQMSDEFELPKNIHNETITRIKILSGLRIDEHQAAQDGRFRLLAHDKVVDVRVSIVPTFFGENAVMRLLVDKEEDYTLESLGFLAANMAKVQKEIKKPFGMILVTGPTGSGKTTTLYTILKILNKPQVSIVTIEDPIEYAVDGIEQIQVNPRAGLTFATGLRSILRQDPNIIMVGEIRDSETAGIAINTALTGHLVLSTLHTNDPATTLPRLLDMGIEPYLIASTVNIVIGQRLVRKLCERCKVLQEFKQEELNSLSEIIPLIFLKKFKSLYLSVGCVDCNGTGFKGRLALHEVLVISEKIRETILQKSPASILHKVAVEEGMVTMLEDGLEKAVLGKTTLTEVLRVINEN